MLYGVDGACKSVALGASDSGLAQCFDSSGDGCYCTPTPGTKNGKCAAGAGSYKFVSPPQMSCKSGGSWARPAGDVANSVAGVADCAKKCKDRGYKYFGLECPRATVHCQCARTLSGSRKLSSTQCDRKNVGRSHCVGPYKQGGYMLGSHGTGSVYLASEAPPCRLEQISVSEAHTTGKPKDYIELYNSGTTGCSLKGFKMDDSNNTIF